MADPSAGVHYPRSLGEFSSWFGTDADCLDYLERLPWPDESPHLTSHLDKFVFRFNRRRSRSRGMVCYASSSSPPRTTPSATAT